MASIEALRRLGLLVERGFLSAGECVRLCEEMASATGYRATVHEDDGRFGVDADVRRVRIVRVSEPFVALLRERLGALQLRAANHFGTALRRLQPLQFLAYGPGDFYHLHPDSSADPGAAPSVRARKISVIVFLNSVADRPASGVYGGGALTFSGLLRDPRLAGIGVPLSGEPGLVVAFPSDLLHAVEPVTHGERYTIVSWFE
jgi:SM-20-related protein